MKIVPSNAPVRLNRRCRYPRASEACAGTMIDNSINQRDFCNELAMARGGPRDVLKRLAPRGADHSRAVHVQAHAHPKMRQAAKIGQLGEALVAAGYRRLDQQAKVLGLSRSTAWTILKAAHKNSGLSAAVINRMLNAPHLPQAIRALILEYVEEKRAGLYGDDRVRAKRFSERIETARASR